MAILEKLMGGFYDELSWLCLNQYGSFNSPVWFNVGLYQQYGVGKNSAQGNWVYDQGPRQSEELRHNTKTLSAAHASSSQWKTTWSPS
jgi:hypothetical protein